MFKVVAKITTTAVQPANGAKRRLCCGPTTCCTWIITSGEIEIQLHNITKQVAWLKKEGGTMNGEQGQRAAMPWA
ncbi:Endogenous Retrovirus Group V Member 1 Env Polyprotein [Manis pentadactyla]|nr:Endogenous Retrovirus Group V Member 1 Env Polyprotein [Manis pentadactyla]